jgi:hypothetical protein
MKSTGYTNSYMGHDLISLQAGCAPKCGERGHTSKRLGITELLASLMLGTMFA